ARNHHPELKSTLDRREGVARRFDTSDFFMRERRRIGIVVSRLAPLALKFLETIWSSGHGVRLSRTTEIRCRHARVAMKNVMCGIGHRSRSHRGGDKSRASRQRRSGRSLTCTCAPPLTRNNATQSKKSESWQRLFNLWRD